MVHVAYDTYIRKQDEYKELQNVLASSCKKKGFGIDRTGT